MFRALHLNSFASPSKPPKTRVRHRIQRQILNNFSFQGRQLNSQETWCLNTAGFRPKSRSINRVGFFNLDCSEDVDGYITDLEDGFKEPLHRFSSGEFTRMDVGREIYDFIAMHYVRSQACLLQIKHLVAESQSYFGVTQTQAETEYTRLTSHQDVGVFCDLVDSVSRVLTHYLMCPVVFTGPWLFMTSDKIMHAARVEAEQRDTFVWFPISPSIGLALTSDGLGGQILGPVEWNRLSGQLDFIKVPEAKFLRFQVPVLQQGSAEFANTVNHLMIQGSTELYASDHDAIDSAFGTAEQPTGYRYKLTEGNKHGLYRSG